MEEQSHWQNGVVAIIGPAPDGEGSRPVGAGFVVSAEGLILTCTHVLADAKWPYQEWSTPVQVRFEATSRYTKALVQQDCFSGQTDGDYALLRLADGLPDGVAVLKLGPAAGSEGHTVQFRGYPEGHNGVQGGDGRVLAVVTKRDGRGELQLDSEHATHGYSGGPVWDPAFGRAIGLFQSGRPAPDEIGRLGHVAFAIPAESLEAACPERLAVQPVEELHPVSSDAEYLAGGQRQILERLDRPRQPRPAVPARPPGSKTLNFVGREKELIWLRKRLRAGETAAVAGLRGIGGIGKTELAIQALKELEDDFPGGIHWLTCGPNEVLAIQDQLADALAVQEMPPQDLARRANVLRAALSAREPSLIVLDDIRRRHLADFDHLRPPSPPCALLVTSRRTDLPLPLAAIRRLDVLDETEALNLLAGHLEATWTAPAEETLIDIITLLEGIPLALQLAARQARRISGRRGQQAERVLPDLLAQLHERRRVRVLDGGERPDLSVIVTFDISYDELDEPDRERLMRLGVFAANDFEPAAAAAVWDDDEEEARQALARLDRAGLVEETATGWWMHDLLREYAAERLANPDNRDAQLMARLNHAAYLQRLLASSQRLEVEDWQRLAAIRPEVEAAAEWLAFSWRSDPELAASLVNGIARSFWSYSFEQAPQWFKAGIEAAESTQDSSVASVLQFYLADLLQTRGEYEEAEGLYRASLAAEEAIGDRRSAAITQSSLAGLLTTRGEYEEAEGLYRKGLATVEAIGDRREVALIQTELAYLLSTRGQYDEAEGLYRNSLATVEAIGDWREVAVTQSNLAELLYSRGNYDEAEGLYRRSLAAVEAIGDRRAVAATQSNLAELLSTRGQYDEAERLYRESLVAAKAIGDRRAVAATQSKLASLLSTRGQVGDAERLYRESLAVLEAIGDRRGVAVIQTKLARLLSTRGQYAEAEVLYWESLVGAEAIGDRREVAVTQSSLADLLSTRGQYDEAEVLYRQGLAAFKAIGDRREVAAIQSKLASLLSTRGQHDEGERLYRESLAVKEEIGNRREVAVTQSNLAKLLSTRGQVDEAERLYRKSLAVVEAIGDRRSAAVIRHNLALLLRKREQFEDAGDLHRSALDLADAIGDQKTAAASLMRLGQLALDLGKPEEAIPLLIDAQDRFLAIGLLDWAAQVKELLARAQGEAQHVTLADALRLVRAARAGDETAAEQARPLADGLAQAEQAGAQALGQALGQLLNGADPAAVAADLPDELGQQILEYDWEGQTLTLKDILNMVQAARAGDEEAQQQVRPLADGLAQAEEADYQALGQALRRLLDSADPGAVTADLPDELAQQILNFDW